MPNPIPIGKVVPIAISYVVRRQMQGRPTTLRNMSKRMGLGATTLLSMLERERNLEFVLLQHSEEFIQGNVEILIRDLPEDLYTIFRLTPEQLLQSFNVLLPDEVRPMAENSLVVMTEEARLAQQEVLDPYYKYRLTKAQFNTLEPNLISAKELIDTAREKGYSVSSISRATGGDRMRYKIAGPLWRPYIYQGKRYYLREVLSVLSQSDKSYKFRSTAALKRYKREQLAKAAIRQE